MKIIDGKLIAAEISSQLSVRLDKLKSRGVIPGLTVLLAGDDPASAVYVNRKDKSAKKLGIRSETIRLEETVSQSELLYIIERLNEDTLVHGILVQLPLPDHVNADAILEAISPEKDVDGFHPQNVGLLVLGKPKFVPCTPAGIMEMLAFEKIDPAGKNVVILGRSNIVGKPLANLLLQKKAGANATVTICHTGTKNIEEHTRQADILISALGKPYAVRAEATKKGAVVIDVGINRILDPPRESGYRLVGDVDFDAAKEVASAITPVPGGVGPMTIVMLMKNTVMAAEKLSNSL